MRKDISLRSLIAKSARLESICFLNSCKVFNLSSQKKSNLIFERRKIEDVSRIKKIDKLNLKVGKIKKVLKLEKKHNYFIEDGKYWKHEEKFSTSNIDEIDKLWISVIKNKC